MWRTAPPRHCSVFMLMHSGSNKRKRIPTSRLLESKTQEASLRHGAYASLLTQRVAPAPLAQEPDCGVEEDAALYCVCRRPYDDQRFMIGCEGGCGGWFHPECLGLPKAWRPEHTETWCCTSCSPDTAASAAAAVIIRPTTAPCRRVEWEGLVPVPQVPETVAVLRAPIASDSTSKATVPSAPSATKTAQAFLTQSEWTVAICRNCVGCDTPRPESCFSKKQWKIGLSRRCKECIKLGRQSISRTKFVPPNLVPECGQVPPEKFHAVEKLELEKLERQQVLLRRQKKQWFKTDQAVCCPQCRKWMQSPCLCDGLDCANCGGRIWPQFAPEPDEKAAGGTTAEGATATVATTTPLAVARMTGWLSSLSYAAITFEQSSGLWFIARNNIATSQSLSPGSLSAFFIKEIS